MWRNGRTLLFICLLYAASVDFFPSTFGALSLPQDRPWYDETCKVHRDEEVHSLMDRVCSICHEMFSHEFPNMRVNCRSNCFQNTQFRDCLFLFKP